ncbi:MAG TPA: ATP synthase F0 subunit B [Candidatus Binataceae bacterium]|nr:ATP synthase F0 subunit B [Candidatus Binataceae bacterium]
MHIPPDWGIFGTLIVSFLVFWFIFAWLFFNPFLNLLSERERRFKDLADRTERLLKEEREALEERERQLAAVRREAMAQREAQRRRADEEGANMIAEASAEAHAELDKVKAQIEKDFAAAERQLEQFAASLAVDLARRVLGRPLTANGRNALNN